MTITNYINMRGRLICKLLPNSPWQSFSPAIAVTVPAGSWVRWDRVQAPYCVLSVWLTHVQPWQSWAAWHSPTHSSYVQTLTAASTMLTILMDFKSSQTFSEKTKSPTVKTLFFTIRLQGRCLNIKREPGATKVGFKSKRGAYFYLSLTGSCRLVTKRS